MLKLTKKQEFALFCMEAYKETYKLSGEAVLTLFETNAIFSFLEENYEILHTQSMDYITSEIYELIQNTK